MQGRAPATGCRAAELVNNAAAARAGVCKRLWHFTRGQQRPLYNAMSYGSAAPGEGAPMIGSPGRGGGGASPHSGKETFSIDDGSDMPSAGRLGTFFGVFVPCISSMFGVASFLRLSTIVGQARWLLGHAAFVIVDRGHLRLRWHVSTAIHSAWRWVASRMPQPCSRDSN